MQPVLIHDLNTGSIDEFRLDINNLVEWCVFALPACRSQNCRVIFNLVGGFKSLQGYMQTLGMFYADETVYIFETGGELLRIPKLPVDFEENARQSVLENFGAFRRMQKESIPRCDCPGIPETMLDIADGKCSISAWGQIIWEEVQRSTYSEKVLEPASKRIIISPAVMNAAEDFPRDRIIRFNQAIDKLSRQIDIWDKDNPHSCDLRKLKGNIEFNFWPDMEGWRGYCHWEGSNLVVDDVDMVLGHH